MPLAAAAKLGVAALATRAFVLQTLRDVLLISLAIGWACEILVGHLVGSGKFRMAHRLVRKSLRNGLLASGAMALLAAACAPWLWFALETGRVANLVVLGALRSTGDVIFPGSSAIVSIVLVLGVGSLALGQAYGLMGWWASGSPMPQTCGFAVRGCTGAGKHRAGWCMRARSTSA